MFAENDLSLQIMSLEKFISKGGIENFYFV